MSEKKPPLKPNAYLFAGLFSIVLGVCYRVFEIWYFTSHLKRNTGCNLELDDLKVWSLSLPLEYVLIVFGIVLIGGPVFPRLFLKGST